MGLLGKGGIREDDDAIGHPRDRLHAALYPSIRRESKELTWKSISRSRSEYLTRSAEQTYRWNCENASVPSACQSAPISRPPLLCNSEQASSGCVGMREVD